MAATLFLETTKVPATRSAAEITAVLVRAGATSINTQYEGGKISGLTWSMNLYGNQIYFTMPVQVEPVYQVLYSRKRNKSTVHKAQLLENAERVAWRQLLMWVKVQMAMIELNMVEFGQVFLPYVIDQRRNASVWEVFKGQNLKALASGGEQQ